MIKELVMHALNLRGHRVMANCVDQMNVDQEKNYYLQANARNVNHMKKCWMMLKYVKFQLVEIEKRLIMMVIVSSALILKDS